MSKILGFACHAPSVSLYRQQRPLLGLTFNPGEGKRAKRPQSFQELLAPSNKERRLLLVNNLPVCRSNCSEFPACPPEGERIGLVGSMVLPTPRLEYLGQ